MPKVTFSLDDDTVAALRKAAARSRKSQSLVVREAIAEYSAREERLSQAERDRLLGVLRGVRSRPAMGSQADVDRELREVRRSRRTGWARPGR
jgi:hypothetical protein